MIARIRHLTRRWWRSLSRRAAAPADVEWVESFLLPAERELWHHFGPADQRHTIEVARRFVALRPDASRAEMAGALLHDIGKLESGLGTTMRVVATIMGPRTTRFRLYHDHERLGADLLERGDSDPVTVALVRGQGPAAADLLAADDV